MLQVPVREHNNLASTKAVILVRIMQTDSEPAARINADRIPMNRSGDHPEELGLGHCLSTCPRLVIAMPLPLCFVALHLPPRRIPFSALTFVKPH